MIMFTTTTTYCQERDIAAAVQCQVKLALLCHLDPM